jgi:transcriptional regulator with XRE-family HTH domain
MWHKVSMTLQEWMDREEKSDTWLAEQVGVSRPFITRIRKGERQPSLRIAAKLADRTLLPITTFLRDEAA